MKKTLFIVIIGLIAFLDLLHAGTNLPQSETGKIEHFISEVKFKLTDSTSGIEKENLKNVRFKLILNDAAVLWAVAGQGNNSIQISTGFLVHLRNYVDAVIMGSQFGINNLEERYFNHSCRMALYRSKHRSKQSKSLVEYARLDPNQILQWRNNKDILRQREEFFWNAVVFVFAHEMGHHARAAFYSTSNSDNYRKEQEKKADMWAIRNLTNIGFPPATGAAIACSYIHQYEKYNFLFKKETQHPPSLERILCVLKESYSDIESIYSNSKYFNKPISEYKKAYDAMINIIKEKIEEEDRKDIQYYEDAMKTGSVLASFILGRMHFEGIKTKTDFKRAFYYFELASKAGFEPAYTFLGDLYESGKGVKKDDIKALAWFDKAKKAGLLYGEYRYNSLTTKLEDR